MNGQKIIKIFMEGILSHYCFCTATGSRLGSWGIFCWFVPQQGLKIRIHTNIKHTREKKMFGGSYSINFHHLCNECIIIHHLCNECIIIIYIRISRQVKWQTNQIEVVFPYMIGITLQRAKVTNIQQSMRKMVIQQHENADSANQMNCHKVTWD